MKHIDYPLVKKPQLARYQTHRFWTRKRANEGWEYVKAYSKEDEVICDPFSGSGIYPLEAVRIGRKAIANDADPMAVFIAMSTFLQVDIPKMEQAFQQIEAQVKNKILDLYLTECNKCKKCTPINVTVFQKDDGNPKVYHPKQIRYICKYCGNKQMREPIKEEIDKIAHISSIEINYWYPDQKIPAGVTFNQAIREGAETFAELFTRRNLLAASMIMDQILQIDDKNIQYVMKYAFTSMIHLCTRMTPDRKTRPWSSHWARNDYWLPPIFQEGNVWELFESAFHGKQGVLRGKIDSNKVFKNKKIAESYEDLMAHGDILFLNNSATELGCIPNNSIDYILTDPPYGGIIPHFELATLWALWLKLSRPFEKEITINEFKDVDYFQRSMLQAFKEMWRVLKNNHWMTLCFHNRDINIFNSTIQAASFAGFNLEKLVYQFPGRSSVPGLMRPFGSADGHYYIRFKKQIKPLIEKHPDMASYEQIVIKSIERIIAERAQPTTFTDILKRVYVDLDKHGYLTMTKLKKIETILKEHQDKEFIYIEGKGWDFADPVKYMLDIIPLNERVENAVLEVLKRKPSVTLDDVLQQIFILYQNALTPDPGNVTDILKKYAVASSTAGKWSMKPIVKRRISEHSKFIYFLSIIGQRMGYKIWIGQNEQSDVYEDKKLSKLVSFKNLNFLNLEILSLKRIENIDVLWIRDKEIYQIFEVENTTNITESIIRGAHVKRECKRTIVLPDERSSEIEMKLKEPALIEHIKKFKWKVIYYSALEEFFKTPKAKSPKERDLDKIEGQKVEIDDDGQLILIK